MKLVKVIGSVTSTIKDDSLKGFKLLFVQMVEADGEGKEDYYIAVDTVGLGEGELGLIVTGSASKYTDRTRNKNVDAAIIAKVDKLNVES